MKKLKYGLIGGGLVLALYLAFFHYTEPTEVGIRWNPFKGEISLDPRQGMHFTAPWVLVSKIKTTPTRVCVTSASRSVNCRLVEFVPEHYKTLIAVEGFRYYWWDNRLSFNSGYDDEYRGVKDLLRGYTYGIQQYPFINTLRVYEE